VLALALLASHLVGDFVLQTRWQAAGKLDDRRLRLRHVLAYGAPFYVWVPFSDVAPWRVWAFLGLLGALHFLTDSRRFRSTVGDWIAWRLSEPADERPTGPPPNPWAPIPIMLDQSLHVVQLAALGWLLVPSTTTVVHCPGLW
jgi:hypothetical protein